MEKVAIPWDDGSGDSFYVDFTGLSGKLESLITSDPNFTGLERKKTLVFKTNTNNSSIPYESEAYLTVLQRLDSLIVASFEGVVSVPNSDELIKGGYV